MKVKRKMLAKTVKPQNFKSTLLANVFLFFSTIKLKNTMNTFDNAIKFCSNYPDENTPKNGAKYYFESSNIKSIANEIDGDFKPNELGAVFFFTRFQKVLIDGVYSNSNGYFVGFWYKNGGYRTCRLSEMRKINDPQVLSVGFVL